MNYYHNFDRSTKNTNFVLISLKVRHDIVFTFLLNNFLCVGYPNISADEFLADKMNVDELIELIAGNRYIDEKDDTNR